MVGPLLQNTLESVRELKEVRKTYERIQEKYDAYLAKPDRARDPAVREESYVAETVDYIGKLRAFKSAFELGLVSKVAVGMGGFGEFCWALGQLFRSLEGDLDRLRDAVPQWQEEASVRLATLKQAPCRPNGLVLLEQLKAGRKSGHLYRRSGKSLGKGPWKRAHARLDGAEFLLTAPGRLRGQVHVVWRINVLLCELKPVEVPERRNCFEVYTSQKSQVFCTAEGEEDLREWMRAFEAAKALAIQDQDQDAGLLPAPPDADDAQSVETMLPDARPARAAPSYLLHRENAALHDAVALAADELVLASFCCLVRVACERFLSGKLYVTVRGLHLLPSALLPPDGSHPRALSVAFEGVAAVEAVPGEHHLLASAILRLDDELAVGGGAAATELTLMAIDQGALDTVARLHRNSRQASPKTTSDLLRELSLSTRPPPPSADAPGAEEPAGAAAGCGCEDHLEAVQVNAVLPVAVDTLWEWLDPAHPVMQRVFAARQYFDIQTEGFRKAAAADGAPRKERQFTFKIPMSNPLLKAKETTCYETGVLLREEPGTAYVLATDARTPQVPYGDAFVTQSRLCLAALGATRTRLTMSFGMQWKRSPLVKGIIRDAAGKGYGKYCELLVASLTEQIKATRPPSLGEGADDEPVIVVEAAPAAGGPGRSGALREMLADLLGLVWGAARSVPLASLALLLLVLLWFSLVMTRATYRALFAHPTHIVVDPASPAAPRHARWHDAHYQEAYALLGSEDRTMQLLGEDVVMLARDMDSLRHRLHQGQQAAVLADQLTQCYEQGRDCGSLEAQWSALTAGEGCMAG